MSTGERATKNLEINKRVRKTMQAAKRIVGAMLLSSVILVNTGCDTTTGALSGGAIGAGLGALADPRHPWQGAAYGTVAGAITGAIIGHINEEQRARLQQQSPQTLQTIQHNDDVAAANANAANAAPAPAAPAAPGQPAQPAQPAPAAEQPTPLTVDDVKAMASSGIKSDVIIAEIQTSKTVFHQQDIDAVQAATPPIDPAVIECMRKTVAG